MLATIKINLPSCNAMQLTKTNENERFLLTKTTFFRFIFEKHTGVYRATPKEILLFVESERALSRALQCTRITIQCVTSTRQKC